MKIINGLLALIFFCCAAFQAEADVFNDKDYHLLVIEMAIINDINVSPLWREFAFNLLEEKFEGEIKKNKKYKRKYSEYIEYLQEELEEISSGKGFWVIASTDEELDEIRQYNEEKIQKYLQKISNYDEKIVMIEQLMSEVQLMRNGSEK